ncbi:MAG: RHS repeat-associated core domain-containing protein [Bacteroidales bacterium]
MKKSDYGLPSYPQNRYLYNGKEINPEKMTSESLNWLDYGWRMYDAQLGRFHTQDRFAEKYNWMTPYQYGANNPVLMIDVNGDSVQVTGRQKNVDQFISMLNARTGNTYAVQNGYLVRTSENLNLETNGTVSGELSQIMEQAITGNGVILVDIVKNKDNVLVDSYQTGALDVGDLQSIGDAAMVAGLIGHVFSERMATTGEGGYGNAANRTPNLGDFSNSPVHQAGLQAEGRIVTSMLGIPYAPRTESNNIVPNSSNTGYNVVVTFTYGTASYQFTHSSGLVVKPGEFYSTGRPVIDATRGNLVGGRIITPATRIR